MTSKQPEEDSPSALVPASTPPKNARGDSDLDEAPTHDFR